MEFAEVFEGRIAALKRWRHEAIKAGDHRAVRHCRVREDADTCSLHGRPRMNGWRGQMAYYTAYAEVCDQWLAWARMAGVDNGTAQQAGDTARRLCQKAWQMAEGAA